MKRACPLGVLVTRAKQTRCTVTSATMTVPRGMMMRLHPRKCKGKRGCLQPILITPQGQIDKLKRADYARAVSLDNALRLVAASAMSAGFLSLRNVIALQRSAHQRPTARPSSPPTPPASMLVGAPLAYTSAENCLMFLINSFTWLDMTGRCSDHGGHGRLFHMFKHGG